MHKTILASAAAFLALSGNAAGTEVGRSQSPHYFMNQADLNKDLVVTKDELAEWSRKKANTWGPEVAAEDRSIMLRFYMSTWERMSFMSKDGVVRVL